MKRIIFVIVLEVFNKKTKKLSIANRFKRLEWNTINQVLHL